MYSVTEIVNYQLFLGVPQVSLEQKKIRIEIMKPGYYVDEKKVR
ncbi:MAG: hypothetical protein QM479_10005 [Pseudomonadota bacterium]